MPIKRRTDYAVRMMCELAQLPPGVTLSIRDACEVTDIPEGFGVTIAAFLVESSLVSARGLHNQLLSLARSASAITMDEVVYACEPEFALSVRARDPHSCKRSSHWGASMMWESLDSIIADHLRSITLADVAYGTDHLLTEMTVAPSAPISTCTGSTPSATNANR